MPSGCRAPQPCALLSAALLLSGSATAHAAALVPAITDLTLTRDVNNLFAPTSAEFLPDGRLVILQQSGEVRVRPAGGGALIDAGSIPVGFSGEQGLLGLAVDPQFSSSNRLYFYYSKSGTGTLVRNRVAYTTLDPSTSILDTANLVDIIDDIYGPANHNGGGIKFGPDGLLYVGAGDTGCNCGCAPGLADNFFGTCLTVLNGKILRVARDGSIPATNPLVGVGDVTACGTTCGAGIGGTAPARSEIYNWGFRNPWRFSFDEQTGYLWIGDVGEVTWEEITVSTGPALHHGWPFREGLHGNDPATACQAATPSSVGPCKEPAFEYAHSGGNGSVTGGVFSNHCSWPAPYEGLYWFGDYSGGRVWTLTPNTNRDGITGGRVDIVNTAGGPVHFFNGPDGAIYYVGIDQGEIWKIAPSTPDACTPTDGGIADTGIADAGIADAGPDQADGSPPADANITSDGGAGGSSDAMTTGVDAGPGVRDAGTARADAAGSDSGGEEDDTSGCRAFGSPESSTLVLLSLALAWGIVRLRRARRRS